LRREIRSLRKLFTRKRLFFVLTGVVCFSIGDQLLALLINAFEFEQNTANLSQTVITLQINFLLSYFVTWQEQSAQFKRSWLQFNSSRVVVLGATLILFGILTSLHIPYRLANIISIAIGMIGNYITSDRYVFKTAIPNER
jgi:putative flippase GtrA